MDAQTMTKDDLDTVADMVAQRVAEKILRTLKQDREEYQAPRSMDFDTACRELFRGHSREWVKYWVMSKHPEILTDEGGWITPARGRGAKIEVVDVDRAKKWMSEHGQTIRWEGKEPKTLMAHGML